MSGNNSSVVVRVASGRIVEKDLIVSITFGALVSNSNQNFELLAYKMHSNVFVFVK